MYTNIHIPSYTCLLILMFLGVFFNDDRFSHDTSVFFWLLNMLKPPASTFVLINCRFPLFRVDSHLISGISYVNPA